jgi:hypothetical protein
MVPCPLESAPVELTEKAILYVTLLAPAADEVDVTDGVVTAPLAAYAWEDTTIGSIKAIVAGMIVLTAIL